MATLEIESNWINKINNTLLNCTIPLKVTETRQTPEHNATDICMIDYNDFEKVGSSCPDGCNTLAENSAHYRVIDTDTNKVVAFVGVDFDFDNDNDKCAYLNYMCTHKEKRGSGLGTFLAFIAVIAAENNGMDNIFSYGDGDKLDLTNNADFKNYKRSGWDTEGKKKMVISQYLNIVKLGFQDNYEGTDTEFKKKMEDFEKKCNEFAETVLYLRDPIKNKKWNEYKKNFYKRKSTNLPKYPYTNKKKHENRIEQKCPSILSMTDLAKEFEVIKNEDENSGKKKSKNGGKKKTTKVRKHQGIIQTGGNAGRLRKGYRYSGKKLKSGLPQIIKCKSKKC